MMAVVNHLYLQYLSGALSVKEWADLTAFDEVPASIVLSVDGISESLSGRRWARVFVSLSYDTSDAVLGHPCYGWTTLKRVS